jgi:hypothetical protein
MADDRLFPALPNAVKPGDADDYAARPILDKTHGQEHARRAVLDGVLKPSDIESARIDSVRLLFVPFWRVDISVDGFHVDLGRVTVGNGRIPLPTGGTRHKEAVVMVAARKTFSYEAKLPSWMSGKLDGIAPLEVGLAEILARSQMPAAELTSGEVVDADMTKDEATHLAGRMVVRATSPQSALISKYEPTVKSAIFCSYPVYYARYEYAGLARRSAGEEFFVCVSARTGKTVSAHHPSVVRAAAEKFRKLLTFGF